MTQQSKATDDSSRQAVIATEITPEMIQAVRDWLADPRNYLSIQEGGEGDIAALIQEIVRRSRS